MLGILETLLAVLVTLGLAFHPEQADHRSLTDTDGDKEGSVARDIHNG